VVEAARGDWLATHLPLLPGGQAADSPHAPAGAKLVIAGEIVAVRPDDWLVADLPGGADVLPARALAWKLAEAGAQAYELLRLEGGRAVLVAHGVSRPEAVGPALDLVPGTRGWLRAGMAASDTEILAALNATVLGPVQASNAAAAMTRRYLREVAPLREGLVESHEEQVAHLEGQTQSLTVEVERLKGELTERYAREDALRARLARIDATPWRRLRRKLARVVRLMRAKASGEGDGSR
jgi:hypothetical protein